MPDGHGAAIRCFQLAGFWLKLSLAKSNEQVKFTSKISHHQIEAPVAIQVSRRRTRTDPSDIIALLARNDERFSIASVELLNLAKLAFFSAIEDLKNSGHER
ncbi:MAG: hypothetical protein V3W41_16240 [Planctomycetota bacterium]